MAWHVLLIVRALLLHNKLQKCLAVCLNHYAAAIARFCTLMQVLQYSTVYYPFGEGHLNCILYCTVLCCALTCWFEWLFKNQYVPIECNTMSHCTILFCITVQYTILYSTVLYSFCWLGATGKSFSNVHATWLFGPAAVRNVASHQNSYKALAWNALRIHFHCCIISWSHLVVLCCKYSTMLYCTMMHYVARTFSECSSFLLQSKTL